MQSVQCMDLLCTDAREYPMSNNAADIPAMQSLARLG